MFLNPSPERVYRVLGMAYDGAGDALVWTPRFGFRDELTARLHGIRLLVDECERQPGSFARQNPWIELTEGTGWDASWRPVEGGRRTDAAWLSPFNGDVMWELGQPLCAIVHAPPVRRPPAPLVLDLPWYPASSRDVEPTPEVAEEPPKGEWWRIFGFVHTGFLTRLALFEPMEFGQESDARRAAEDKLSAIVAGRPARERSLRYSVELRTGTYRDGQWVARKHVATAHLDLPSSVVSWTVPLRGTLRRTAK